MISVVKEPDGVARCSWCTSSSEYIHYHDSEWGFPEDDDQRLFEKLCLESFQSGLSWRTILAKREGFRSAFKNFEIDKVARFTTRDIERLLRDEGIVRHRGKIEATINNAKLARELAKREGSLVTFFWSYEPDPKLNKKPVTVSKTPESTALSKDLRKMGWKFVGPTTVYSFMQAIGMVNDHAVGCSIRPLVEKARRAFKRP